MKNHRVLSWLLLLLSPLSIAKTSIVGVWCQTGTSLKLDHKIAPNIERWQFQDSGILYYARSKGIKYEFDGKHLTIDSPFIGNYELHALSDSYMVLSGVGFLYLSRGECDRATYSDIVAMQNHIIRGNEAGFESLFNEGTDPNLLIDGTSGSNSLIHLSAKYGRLSILKFLLSKGADPSIKNEEGKTAFDLAKENNHIDIINYLNNNAKK